MYLLPAILDALCAILLCIVIFRVKAGKTWTGAPRIKVAGVANILRTLAQIALLLIAGPVNPLRVLTMSQAFILLQFIAALILCCRVSWKERKEIERQAMSLMDAEVRFLSVIENAPEAIALVDADGCFILTNRKLIELTGLDGRNTVGLSFLSLLHPEDRPLVAANFHDQLAGLRTQYRQRTRFIRIDGEIIWGDLSATAIRDDAGKFRYGLGIVTDITALVKAEEQSQALLAAKEQFIIEMNHRIKNNIQIIASLLALEDGKMETPTARLSLEKTLDRVRSIALAHEKAAESPDRASVNLTDLVTELVADLEYASYAVRGIDTRIEGQDIVITLDQAIPIAIILTELIANAHLHTFAGLEEGKLLISATADDSWVTLNISDDGKAPGFTPDNRRPDDEGFNIVEALMAQLGGNIAWDTGEGQSCRIGFPREQGVREVSLRTGTA